MRQRAQSVTASRRVKARPQTVPTGTVSTVPGATVKPKPVKLLKAKPAKPTAADRAAQWLIDNRIVGSAVAQFQDITGGTGGRLALHSNTDAATLAGLHGVDVPGAWTLDEVAAGIYTKLPFRVAGHDEAGKPEFTVRGGDSIIQYRRDRASGMLHRPATLGEDYDSKRLVSLGVSESALQAMSPVELTLLAIAERSANSAVRRVEAGQFRKGAKVETLGVRDGVQIVKTAATEFDYSDGRQATVSESSKADAMGDALAAVMDTLNEVYNRAGVNWDSALARLAPMFSSPVFFGPHLGEAWAGRESWAVAKPALQFRIRRWLGATAHRAAFNGLSRLAGGLTGRKGAGARMAARVELFDVSRHDSTSEQLSPAELAIAAEELQAAIFGNRLRQPASESRLTAIRQSPLPVGRLSSSWSMVDASQCSRSESEHERNAVASRGTDERTLARGVLFTRLVLPAINSLRAAVAPMAVRDARRALRAAGKRFAVLSLMLRGELAEDACALAGVAVASVESTLRDFGFKVTSRRAATSAVA
jgi:hypothetical protein